MQTESKSDPVLPTIFVWAFALLTMLMLLSFAANAQISPGPLSKAHKEMDGVTGCIKCHQVSPGAPSFRCLACHQEIANRLEQKRGYHPALVKSAPGSTSCVRCHSEHNGENFLLVKWNPKDFEHAKAGFALDGKHAGLACEHCHNAKNIAATERASLTAKDFNRTHLGLSKTCTSCHEDKHQGRLGPNCQQCHDANDWKGATKSFDHAKTRYPLAGAHKIAKCENCHRKQPDGTEKFAGLRFDTCDSCHKDVHLGGFNQSCQTCHGTASWKETSFVREFDHSKTKFALAGKHVEIACDTCHRGGDFKAPIAHTLCADCHKPDPHNGQFAKRADGGKCESCHTVDEWKPSKFLAGNHANTGFPLRGRHFSVDCAKCHEPAGKATLYKVKFALCTDCHKDAHQGQFARTPYLNRCEKCHTETDFRAPTFTVDRHQKSSFVLTGGHMAVACRDCHKATATNKSVTYHFTDLSCTACHTDPHKNQFRDRMLGAGAGGRTAGCEACHTTKRWNDLTNFDHSTTKFTLVGAHRAVECTGCHRPPNMERKLRNVDFKSAPLACEQCHNDPHGSQFAYTDQLTRCSDCHDSTHWRPSLFDHEKTIFPLKGAHHNTPCKGCHTQSRVIAGKQVLFYKPTTTKCSACHGDTLQQAS